MSGLLMTRLALTVALAATAVLATASSVLADTA